MFLRTACAILLATTASLSFAQSLAGRNSLIGVVTESSDADKLKTQMTFVDLDKQVVTVVWPSGHQYKMSKTFDSKGIVVLQFVGEMTGSINPATNFGRVPLAGSVAADYDPQHPEHFGKKKLWDWLDNIPYPY